MSGPVVGKEYIHTGRRKDGSTCSSHRKGDRYVAVKDEVSGSVTLRNVKDGNPWAGGGGFGGGIFVPVPEPVQVKSERTLRRLAAKGATFKVDRCNSDEPWIVGRAVDKAEAYKHLRNPLLDTDAGMPWRLFALVPAELD